VRASGVLVGAVVRGEEVIRPRGETIIKAKDRVVLIARSDSVKRIEQLFAVRLDYF
jgi:trk system potassium uptake protein TrkA